MSLFQMLGLLQLKFLKIFFLREFSQDFSFFCILRCFLRYSPINYPRHSCRHSLSDNFRYYFRNCYLGIPPKASKNFSSEFQEFLKYILETIIQSFLFSGISGNNFRINPCKICKYIFWRISEELLKKYLVEISKAIPKIMKKSLEIKIL